jgi:hypothetical protein
LFFTGVRIKITLQKRFSKNNTGFTSFFASDEDYIFVWQKFSEKKLVVRLFFVSFPGTGPKTDKTGYSLVMVILKGAFRVMG